MKILIFGASGATGRELVQQSLTKGHSVTAFVRDPSNLKLQHERLSVIKGDVKDPLVVDRAVQSQDVVVSALGVSKPLKKDPVVVEGIRNIVGAMEQRFVKRLIYLSFIAAGPGKKDAGFMIRNIVSRIVRNEIEDHIEKENIIKTSNLDWTIVHPPKLTNGRAKNKYRIGENIKTKSFLPSISRADVAGFMLSQLNDNSYLRKTVRILN